MIISRRRTALRELGASLATYALVHSAFRLHIVVNEGVVSEDRLSLRAFDRKGYLHRPMLTVVLEGRARLEQDGMCRWLEAGDVSVLPNKNAVAMRQEGARFESLAVEWDPGTLGARPTEWSVSRLPAEAITRLKPHVRAVAAHGLDGERAAARFAAIVTLLRESGAPLGRAEPGDLVEAVPEPMRVLSGALDATLSDLSRRPMMIDLHRMLGTTPRHLLRLVTAFHASYGFGATGWRDALNRRRLLHGAAMMTARGATSERVAMAVGYGSPAAFWHGLAQAGLPSPGTVPRVVADLV